jgi:ERCC4-type nuclease
MSKCILAVDNRERKILAHTNELNEIKWEAKQLTVGDYAWHRDGELIALAERKTLEDYAASLKDGRANNKDKMLDLREKTGCRVFYIIEGPKSPSPNAQFARIAYKCIKRSIQHLMFRDGIIIIQTVNTLDTARELVELTLSIDTLIDKIGDASFLRQRTSAIASAGTSTSTSTSAITIASTSTADFALDELTTPIKKSDHDIVREMWSCFKGVTVETADSYIAKWSVADIVTKKIPRTVIEEHRMPSRRKISTTVVNALLTSGPVIDSKLLSKIPQISTRTANELLKGRSLVTIVTSPKDIIATYTTGKLQTKLGQTRADSVLRLFHYCDQPHAPASDNGTVLGTASDTSDMIEEVVSDDVPVVTVAPTLPTPAASVTRVATVGSPTRKPVVVRRPIARPKKQG